MRDCNHGVLLDERDGRDLSSARRRSVSWKWLRSAPHIRQGLATSPVPLAPSHAARHAPAPFRSERWNAIPVFEQHPKLGDEAEHGRTQTVSDPHAQKSSEQPKLFLRNSLAFPNRAPSIARPNDRNRMTGTAERTDVPARDKCRGQAHEMVRDWIRRAIRRSSYRRRRRSPGRRRRPPEGD